MPSAPKVSYSVLWLKQSQAEPSAFIRGQQLSDHFIEGEQVVTQIRVISHCFGAVHTKYDWALAHCKWIESSGCWAVKTARLIVDALSG